MNQPNAALLLNLLGFAVGIALYSMLLVMTLRRRPAGELAKKPFAFDGLLILTAMLGLLWNAGELFSFVWHDLAGAEIAPALSAAGYASLGFLPAVVVHAARQTADETDAPKIDFLIVAAYVLSAAAAGLHFQAAILSGETPSILGFRILTVGYSAVLVLLFFLTRRQTVGRKTIWASALAVFAVSALHLSQPHTGGSWLVEMVAHQASLPLAFAILFQNFRFAFADLFLKRALSLFLLAAAVFGLYVFLAAPLLRFHAQHGETDLQPSFTLLGLWMATALLYPYLHRLAVWFVDKILLRRADYERLRAEIAGEVAGFEQVEPTLEIVCRRLAAALTAERADWGEIEQPSRAAAIVRLAANSAEIFVPVAEAPFYQIRLRDFAGARRLLSDEIEMLESIALTIARRIDRARVTHERCEQELREQQSIKFAAEAELRALRAQINPHFLFNALTTIGYLIQTAPDRALETLLKLTRLLRGVLRASGEFSTLGDELKLIESYLEIEQARFEERLTVKIAVSPELKTLRVPALILQPLVENAVKHGISKAKAGGTVTISARVENQNLLLEVADTGAGFDKSNPADKPARGIGLSNVENRLQSHFGAAASLDFESGAAAATAGRGATVKITLPLQTQKQIN